MSATFELQVAVHGPAGLRAHATGQASLANTVACWEALLAHVAAHRAKFLLLVDELRGPPLAAHEWQQLVQAMAGRGLEHVRIAHVKPRGLERIEYCQIYANEAGLDTRVFADERAAELWLRYGADAGRPDPSYVA